MCASGSAIREGPRGDPGLNRTGGARPGQSPAAVKEGRRERLPDGPVHDHRRSALDRPRGPLPTRLADLPDLPRAYADVLDAGLGSLGVSLSAANRSAIDGHARLLLAWTAAINLTAIRDPAAIARLHVLDSLSAVPLLRAAGVRRLLDVGSGGGFPGIPLAVALGGERVLLVDSVAKKVRFLHTVIEATGIGPAVGAEAARAETLARDPRHRERWPVVTARAVSPLAELVELALPLVAPGGILVAWKREPVDEELAAAGPALAALQAGPVEVVDPGVPGLEAHRLVVVPRGGRIDKRYPREPAVRRRQPP